MHLMSNAARVVSPAPAPSEPVTPAPISAIRLARASTQPQAVRGWRFTMGELALQDWIVAGYLLTFLTFIVAGEGPRRSTALTGILVDLAFFLTTLALVRGGLVRGVLAALLYRFGLFGAVFGSFCQLNYILPTVRSSRLDAQLYALDTRLFGG